MKDIISMYLKCIDARFGQDSEKEIHKQIIDWNLILKKIYYLQP